MKKEIVKDNRYPTYRFHPDGRQLLVKSEEEEPGEPWGNKLYPVQDTALNEFELADVRVLSNCEKCIIKDQEIEKLRSVVTNLESQYAQLEIQYMQSSADRVSAGEHAAVLKELVQVRKELKASREEVQSLKRLAAPAPKMSTKEFVKAQVWGQKVTDEVVETDGVNS